jgi:hypothetical protein
MKLRVRIVCASLTLLGFPALALADDAPPGENLEAGGLKPPAPIEANANPPPSQPEAELDLAKKEDSGRGLEFVWLNAEAGGEYLGLQTLRARQLVDSKLVGSKGLGAVYGAGLGVRFLVFTFGARFRLGNFQDWQTWTLNGEAGLRIPLGRIEPYFTLGGGYASLGDFSGSDLAATLKSASVHATGFDVRTGAGVDVFVTNTFSIGGNLTGEALFLSRSGSVLIRGPATPGNPDQQNAEGVFVAHGSGIGVGATLSAVLGLHF